MLNYSNDDNAFKEVSIIKSKDIDIISKKAIEKYFIIYFATMILYIFYFLKSLIYIIK